MSEEMDEIWQLFGHDGCEALDSVEESLVFLQRNPRVQTNVGALFRAVHTFKGNCRVLGLSVMESQAHMAEDLIGLVRDEGAPLDAEMLELLLETLDALRGMLEECLASHRDADSAQTASLTQRMQAKFERCKSDLLVKGPAETPSPPQTELVSTAQPATDAESDVIEAIFFDSHSDSAISEDPTYRLLFTDMVEESLREMRRVADLFSTSPDAAREALKRAAEQLRFAAERVAMRDWVDALDNILAIESLSAEPARSAIAELTAMFQRDFDAARSTPSEEPLSSAHVAGSDDQVRAPSDSLAPEEEAPDIEMTSIDRSPGAARGAARKHEADRIRSDGLTDDDTTSSSMLESVGAIITGQAVVHQTLSDIADFDLVRAVDLKLLSSRGDWSLAREPVSRYLSELQEKIEKLVQVDSQVHSLLDRLQEQMIEVRNRPSALLLKPLVSYGEEIARQSGREVAVTVRGNDTRLDFSTLRNLDGHLRTLLAFSILQSLEPREARLAAGKDPFGQVVIDLVKRDDQVVVTLDDDGRGVDLGRIADRLSQLNWEDDGDPMNIVLRDGFGALANDDSHGHAVDFSELNSNLRAHGGGLRLANRQSGGAHFTVALPLAMTALDGMVVRVGQVMYILPIESVQRIVHSEASSLIDLSASEGRYMLKPAPGDIVPIQFLKQSGQVDEHQDVNPFFLAPDAAEATEPEDARPRRIFVVAGKSMRRIALPVDELVGQQMVVNRPLQGYLSGIRGVTGCALLGSGGVGMVLDMGYVLGAA